MSNLVSLKLAIFQVKIRINSQYFHADYSTFIPLSLSKIQFFFAKIKSFVFFSYLQIQFLNTNLQRKFFTC